MLRVHLVLLKRRNQIVERLHRQTRTRESSAAAPHTPDAANAPAARNIRAASRATRQAAASPSPYPQPHRRDHPTSCKRIHAVKMRPQPLRQKERRHMKVLVMRRRQLLAPQHRLLLAGRSAGVKYTSGAPRAHRTHAPRPAPARSSPLSHQLAPRRTLHVAASRRCG